MSHDTGMLRAKLRNSFERVGHSNGHAPPKTGNNIDPILHEMFIAGEAEYYWKTRNAKAKKAGLAAAGNVVDEVVAETLKHNAPTSRVALTGDAYVLSIDVKRPATTLDAKALRNYLQVNCGMTAEQVEQAFAECSKQSAPAKTLKVTGQ